VKRMLVAIYRKRELAKWGLLAGVCLALSGCAHIGGGIGISLPIGPFGSVGVNLNSDGRVGGSIGIGVGGASISVGTSGKLLPAKAPNEN
jgi:hypothetical protein